MASTSSDFNDVSEAPTYSGQNMTSLDPVLDDVTYHVLAVILTTVSLVGIVLNTLNAIALRKFASLRTATNVLLEALVWSDLVMAGVANTIVAVCLFYRRWLLGPVGVIFYGFMATFLGLFAIHLLTAISIERYVAVLHPFSPARSIETSQKIAIGCMCLSLFWSVTPLIGWNHYALEGLAVSASVNWVANDNWQLSYIVSLLFFCFIVPVAIISFTYGSIMRVVRATDHQVRLHDPNLAAKKEKRQKEAHLSKVTFSVICAFFISWTPYAIAAMVTVFSGPSLELHVSGTLPAILAKSSVCWNPLVYTITNPKLRGCVWQMLMKWRAVRVGVLPPSDGEGNPRDEETRATSMSNQASVFTVSATDTTRDLPNSISMTLSPISRMTLDPSQTSIFGTSSQGHRSSVAYSEGITQVAQPWVGDKTANSPSLLLAPTRKPTHSGSKRPSDGSVADSTNKWETSETPFETSEGTEVVDI